MCFEGFWGSSYFGFYFCVGFSPFEFITDTTVKGSGDVLVLFFLVLIQLVPITCYSDCCFNGNNVFLCFLLIDLKNVFTLFISMDT